MDAPNSVLAEVAQRLEVPADVGRLTSGERGEERGGRGPPPARGPGPGESCRPLSDGGHVGPRDRRRGGGRRGWHTPGVRARGASAEGGRASRRVGTLCSGAPPVSAAVPAAVEHVDCPHGARGSGASQDPPRHGAECRDHRVGVDRTSGCSLVGQALRRALKDDGHRRHQAPRPRVPPQLSHDPPRPSHQRGRVAGQQRGSPGDESGGHRHQCADELLRLGLALGQRAACLARWAISSASR